MQGKNGLTALHVSAHYNHPAVAQLLLENKASPHAVAKVCTTSIYVVYFVPMCQWDIDIPPFVMCFPCLQYCYPKQIIEMYQWSEINGVNHKWF